MVQDKARVSDTLGRQVGQAIERDILEGKLRPGQRLNADELASAFGVSRIPVREALRSLDAAGWVEIRPRHGAFVRRRSLRELDDLFHVRSMLEADAARLAARHRSDAQLAEISAAHEALVDANRRGEPLAAAEANSRFHREVARASGNAVLADLAEQLAKRIRWYFATVVESRAVHSAEEHGLMLAAIKDGDSRTASRLVHEHVMRTSALVRQALGAELDGDGDAASDQSMTDEEGDS